jgi:hypothetical protein
MSWNPHRRRTMTIYNRASPFVYVNRDDISLRYNSRKRYRWVGVDPGASSGMFHVTDCREPIFEGIDIYVEANLTNVFYFENRGGKYPMTRPVLRDVRIFCHGNAERCFYHAVGNNENNEHSLYDNVTCYDYRSAAWTFQGQQSKGHRLNSVRCGVDRRNPLRAPHAIECYGSMQVNGFSAYGHRGSDILLGAVVDSIVVRDVDSESSGSLLSAPDFSGDYQPITISGGSVRTDMLTPPEEGDEIGYVIDVNHMGPLHVTGLQIGSGTQPIGGIYHAGSRCFVAGNSWGSFGSKAVCNGILYTPDQSMKENFEFANGFED